MADARIEWLTEDIALVRIFDEDQDHSGPRPPAQYDWCATVTIDGHTARLHNVLHAPTRDQAKALVDLLASYAKWLEFNRVRDGHMTTICHTLPTPNRGEDVKKSVGTFSDF